MVQIHKAQLVINTKLISQTIFQLKLHCVRKKVTPKFKSL